ncbi:putative lysine-specific demethylase ELF6 [Senna tora]|uniref:Putative lysine-specific demethylase ELF6 n=1 Tax=Senna tora TaxID=362788 RepID=A0A834TFN1_9FABA|nr:putative lysine-specific demethylase ELF6 [Senna tora]
MSSHNMKKLPLMGELSLLLDAAGSALSNNPARSKFSELLNFYHFQYKSERKAASLNFALVWLFPSMHPDMLSPCPCPLERHGATFPWALEGPIIVMDTLVKQSIFVGSELLSTPFMRAAVAFMYQSTLLALGLNPSHGLLTKPWQIILFFDNCSNSLFLFFRSLKSLQNISLLEIHYIVSLKDEYPDLFPGHYLVQYEFPAAFHLPRLQHFASQQWRDDLLELQKLHSPRSAHL